jgi:hypothetical protein
MATMEKCPGWAISVMKATVNGLKLDKDLWLWGRVPGRGGCRIGELLLGLWKIDDVEGKSTRAKYSIMHARLLLGSIGNRRTMKEETLHEQTRRRKYKRLVDVLEGEKMKAEKETAEG